MFDLTGEIKLDPPWQKRYLILRSLAYVLFAAAVIFLAYRLFFPSQSFSFSFQNPDSSKNTIINPRDSLNNYPGEGEIKAGGKIIFDAITVDDFSKAKIKIYDGKNIPSGKIGTVFVRKSYRAFFYPLEDPLGFKDGGLIKNKGNFFIVSAGKMRKFSSPEVVSRMGYYPVSFIEAKDSEMNYNEKGEDITQTLEYPDDAIFKIAGEFYQLKNQRLVKFISERAYLSQYSPGQATEKSGDFLNRYELSEDNLGFADGTLISFGDSAYIASGMKLFPIMDALTFESMGFDWNFIIPASEDEISAYEKQKAFNIKQPHPDGTVFTDENAGTYFYIQDGTRRELKGPDIASSYLRAQRPVAVEEKGLEIKDGCDLKKSIFGTWGCIIPTQNLEALPGNDYQFEAQFNSDAKINTLQASLIRTITWNNLRTILSGIKQKLITHYALQ